MTTFPSRAEIKRVNKLLRNRMGSRSLRENATPIEKLKYEICAQFVMYYNKQRGLTQQEFAKKLGIDPAIMNKILHYHFDRFTVDRLFTYLEILHPKARLDLKVG